MTVMEIGTDAQIRLADLEDERARLAAEIDDLTAEHAAASNEHESVLATTGRQPTPANEKAAKQHADTLTSLAEQLQRKQAALAQVERDMKEAQAAKAQERRREALAELEDFFTRINELAGALDSNLAQPEVWGELVVLTQRANAIYIRNFEGKRRLFEKPDDVVKKVFDQAKGLCVQAVRGAPTNKRVHEKPPKPTEVLRLNDARRQLEQLRRDV